MGIHQPIDALSVPPILARAVDPDADLMRAYQSDDPDEFWAVHSRLYPDSTDSPDLPL